MTGLIGEQQAGPLMFLCPPSQVPEYILRFLPFSPHLHTSLSLYLIFQANTDRYIQTYTHTKVTYEGSTLQHQLHSPHLQESDRSVYTAL